MDLVDEPDAPAPTARPGGAPANTAVAAARLGVPTAFCGRISTDAHGEMLLTHLQASGVRLELVERGPEPTAIAHVERDPTPVFRFEGEGTADTVLGPVDIGALDLTPGSPLILHSGSLAMFRGSASSSILDCFERCPGTALRSFDPNVRPFAISDVGAWRGLFTRWLAAADLLRSSADDLRWIAPGEDPLATAERLLDRGPVAAVVTFGGSGAVAVSPRGTVEVDAAPVEVVDTVGAGDSFTGALLSWLHRREIADRHGLLAVTPDGWRDALDFATTAAGVTCTRVGADPPWADELGATDT